MFFLFFDRDNDSLYFTKLILLHCSARLYYLIAAFIYLYILF